MIHAQEEREQAGAGLRREDLKDDRIRTDADRGCAA